MSVRVLHIAHMQLRRYGATRVSWAKKLDLGLIKAGFEVHNFSDRDVAAFEAPFGYRPLGERKANARLLEMVDNVEPELVVAGHCDSIRNDTLAAIRSRPFVKRIIHCNNDPLFVPSNFERILHRAEVCDSVFVSTGRRCLVERFPALADRIWHMPNPVDAAIERADASQNERYETDLIFASKRPTRQSGSTVSASYVVSSTASCAFVHRAATASPASGASTTTAHWQRPRWGSTSTVRKATTGTHRRGWRNSVATACWCSPMQRTVFRICSQMRR